MTDLSIQNVVPPKVMGTVTLEMLKRYALASGDYNPIHQEESVAVAMGLPGVIAHGMLISSFVTSRALESLAVGTNLSGKKIKNSHTRFRAMTFLGDEISVSGHWNYVEATNIRLDLVAKNQRGENVITAHYLLI